MNRRRRGIFRGRGEAVLAGAFVALLLLTAGGATPSDRLVHRTGGTAIRILTEQADSPTLRSSVNLTSSSNWTNLTNLSPDLSPAGRAYEGFAYDVHDGYLVLYGGQPASGAPLGQTWTLGSDWSWVSRTTASAPSARYGEAMAYDPSDGQLILFGGINGTGATLRDTWSYSAGNWAFRAVAPTPSARAFATLMPAPNGTGVVLFGGLGAAGIALNDTWWFSAGHWTDLTAVSGFAPSPRWQASGTNLSSRGMDVLFGGNSSNGTLGDTWILNVTGWHRLVVSSPPPARAGAAMGFDQVDQEAVLFGGFTPSVGSRQGTTTFNGTGWTLAVNPPDHPHARYGANLAWVGGFGGGISLLFGGAVAVGHVYAGLWAYGSRMPVISGTPSLSHSTVDPGISFSATANRTGGTAPFQYLWTGLPSNCSSVNAPTIQCAPSSAGVVTSQYHIRVTITDAAGTSSASPNASLRVNAPLSVDQLLFSPSPGLIGTSLTINVFVAGGQLPDNISYSQLPPGCDSSNQTPLVCYPTATGLYDVNVTVVDAFGVRAFAHNFVEIDAPVTSAPLWQWVLIGGGITAVAILAVIFWRGRRPQPNRPSPGGPTPGPRPTEPRSAPSSTGPDG